MSKVPEAIGRLIGWVLIATLAVGACGLFWIVLRWALAALGA